MNAERDTVGNLIGRPFIDTLWEQEGKRVRAVGNRVYMRPPDETTHEFLLNVTRWTFGEEWHRREIDQPEEGRHVVQRWLDHWHATQRGESVVKHAERRFSAAMTGDLRALMCLSYDLYTLEHAQALPAGVVKRLRLKDQFQGARYEVAVAAVFARAGYELEWLTARDRRLPEFIASHPLTDSEVVVEAKSRHRPGVLGRPGSTPDPASLRTDVGALLDRALEKEVDGRPLVVCLDLNLPIDRTRTLDEWAADLQSNVFAPFEDRQAGAAKPFSSVFFTNYSWHWDGRQPPGDPMSFVVLPVDPAVRLPRNEAELLAEALFQYGGVPSEIELRVGPAPGRKAA